MGPAFETSDVGITVQGKPTFAEWENAVTLAMKVAKSSPWWVGDLLCYGENRYGETYAQVLSSTDFEYGTVTQYKYVCSQIPLPERQFELTFSHHAVVASMESETRTAWLEQAIISGWTVRELLEALDRSAEIYQGPDTDSVDEFRAEEADGDLSGLLCEIDTERNWDHNLGGHALRWQYSFWRRLDTRADGCRQNGLRMILDRARKQKRPGNGGAGCAKRQRMREEDWIAEEDNKTRTRMHASRPVDGQEDGRDRGFRAHDYQKRKRPSLPKTKQEDRSFLRAPLHAFGVFPQLSWPRVPTLCAPCWQVATLLHSFSIGERAYDS